MSYAEFRLAWTGITPEEKARQQRTRAIDDYYWHYSGAEGLLFSALYYPSALEICRYNFGRNLLDFCPEDTSFKIEGLALKNFIEFALNCQAVVSEGHLRDQDWLIPYQKNDMTILQTNIWQPAGREEESSTGLPRNIGLYRYTASQTPDWIRITLDFIREQALFAKLAQQKMEQGLEVWVVKEEQ